MSGYYFNFKDLTNMLHESRMYPYYYQQAMTWKVNNIKELCGRLPEKNEAFFIETQKSFTAFAFIIYIIKYVGRIQELYIATYSTNERVLASLLRWKEKGMIGKLHLHLSETIQFRMPKIFNRLNELKEEGVLTLSFAWSHKKVTCAKTDQGCYVVEGSGNYGENSMQENYIFLKSKEVYDFRRRIDKVGG